MKSKNKKDQPPAKAVQRSGSRALALLLLLAGLGISLYLMHLHLQIERNQGAGNVCSAVFGVSCEDALRSSVSIQFGVPLAAWGIAYFSGMLTLLLLGSFLRESFDYESTLVAFTVSIPAAIASVILLLTMLFGKTGFCPFCATIHAINFILLFVLKRQTARPLKQVSSDILSGRKFFGVAEDAPAAKSRMVAILAAMLVAIACLEGALLQSTNVSGPVESTLPAPVTPGAQPAGPASTQAPENSHPAELQNLMLGPEEEIPVGDQDAIKGPSTAPVQIVIFSDFQCPACRNYAPQLAEIVAQYGDRIQVVFKNFPLDKACNPIVERDMHIRACDAAYAAEAARKQGKFWNYHDALFGSDLLANPDIFQSIAGSLGIDMQQFNQDRQDQSTKAKVRGDIDLGIRVGVNATPSLYLNKRRILDVRPDVVRYLIDQTLKAR